MHKQINKKIVLEIIISQILKHQNHKKLIDHHK